MKNKFLLRCRSLRSDRRRQPPTGVWNFLNCSWWTWFPGGFLSFLSFSLFFLSIFLLRVPFLEVCGRDTDTMVRRVNVLSIAGAITGIRTAGYLFFCTLKSLPQGWKAEPSPWYAKSFLMRRSPSLWMGNMSQSAIQFILCSPISKIMNLPQKALQPVHIHPCPRTSHQNTLISSINTILNIVHVHKTCKHVP